MPKRPKDSSSRVRRRSRRPLAEVLGERIRAERERQALTRVALAQRSGIALTALNLYEQGRVGPQLGTLEALAAALGVPASKLLEEDEAPRQQVTGTKTFFRIVERLRRHEADQAYLRAVERLLQALDEAVEAGRT